MNNIYFDKETKDKTVHLYFKGRNKKMVTPSINRVTIELEDGKTYLIDKKVMYITNQKVFGEGGFQSSPLDLEAYNANISDKSEYRYELVYMRDERIDNKDCILVKECIFDIKTKKYTDNIDSYRKATAVYWIEKSSGMVIGAAWMKEGEKKPKPEVIIKNIQYGNVTDEMFKDMLKIPSDYKVYDDTGGQFIQVK